jgi:hypothetical protein
MGSWVDIFSLSWVVPLGLDSMMSVAFSVYDYFVGGGGGIIYVLIWGFLGFSIGLYLVKMYFPAKWLELFGFSGGGEMYKDPHGYGLGDGSIAKNVLKRMMRAMFAIVVLLQVKPQYIMNFIVNPFLEFGSVYVNSITKIVLPADAPRSKAKCPPDLDEYLTKDSCDFLVSPIDEVSAVNGEMISCGLGFLLEDYSFIDRGNAIKCGFVMAFSRMDRIMNIITGLLLIATFFSLNIFMALLIVQGIFNLGLSLIFYPFRVLLYVVKDDDRQWFNPWDAVSELVKSLQKLVVAMIAVAFMLLVNVSVVGSLFNSGVVRPGGFGGRAIGCIFCILVFWIFQRVFAKTEEKLSEYVGDAEMTEFYAKTATGVKSAAKNVAGWGGKAWKILRGKPGP